MKKSRLGRFVPIQELGIVPEYECVSVSPNSTKPNVGRSASVNVAQNIFDTIFVSTAMWATNIQGYRYPTYETFIWEWDNVKKERGKLIKQYYHPSRGQGLKFHFRFCRLLSYRQLKQKLPNDNSWVDFD